MKRLMIGTVAALFLAVSVASADTVFSTINTSPSTATTVQVGVPFSAGPDNGVPDIYRVGEALRQRDRLVIAVDNASGTEPLNTCLIGPVDDFALDAEVDQTCGDDGSKDYVSSGAKKRMVLEYRRATGQPLLQFSSFFDRVDSYTATIETIIHRVDIGGRSATLRKRKFNLLFAAVFGDNTPAADGITGNVYYRFSKRSGKQPAFRLLTQGSTAGGSIRFVGTLPRAASKQKVQLRFCIQQPGSDQERCASSRLVKVKIRR